jgi:hypothetical protein
MNLIELLRVTWKLHKKSLIASLLVALTVLSFSSMNLEDYRFAPSRSFPTGYFLLTTVSPLIVLLFIVLTLSIIFFWKMRR